MTTTAVPVSAPPAPAAVLSSALPAPVTAAVLISAPLAPFAPAARR
ncbi:hypothetical protein J3R03_000669 [Actinoplanes couchii]|nr:hypothetical protein [Actinoplanes couchii]